MPTDGFVGLQECACALSQCDLAAPANTTKLNELQQHGASINTVEGVDNFQSQVRASDGSVPSHDLLRLMSRTCLEQVLSRPGNIARRTELGIALRDALGSLYQKGWVNHTLAELERQGHGKLTEDGVYFQLGHLDPIGRSVGRRPQQQHVPPQQAPKLQQLQSQTSIPRRVCGPKLGFLLIDGGYYEYLQSRILGAQSVTHTIDFGLLVLRLESALGVSFSERLFVQDSWTGTGESAGRMRESEWRPSSWVGRARQGVGAAMTAQIMKSVYRAAYDVMIVITGGDEGLLPAFRAAEEENQTRLKTGQRVQTVAVVAGQEVKRELLAFLYRLKSGPLGLESIMRACKVPRTQLQVAGGEIGPGPVGHLHGLVGETNTSTEPYIQNISQPSSPASDSSTLASSVATTVSAASSCSHSRHERPQHYQAEFSGSDQRDGVRTVGTAVASRPRRWCNFNQRCKYHEDVQGNIEHFRRFAHVCKDDLRCPHILNHVAGSTSEEARAHCALWKHTCVFGLTCPHFIQPEKHRRHMELFTHKAKVLSSAAASAVQASMNNTTDPVTTHAPPLSLPTSSSLFAKPFPPSMDKVLPLSDKSTSHLSSFASLDRTQPSPLSGRHDSLLSNRWSSSSSIDWYDPDEDPVVPLRSFSNQPSPPMDFIPVLSAPNKYDTHSFRSQKDSVVQSQSPEPHANHRSQRFPISSSVAPIIRRAGSGGTDDESSLSSIESLGWSSYGGTGNIW